MEFRKYNSIENSYRKEFIDRIVVEGKTQGRFVVQEKVHGANLSFCFDGEKLQIAKRTEFLDGEPFYNAEAVAEKYKDALLALYEELAKGTGLTMVVYGELFGGNYPHPDVPKVKDAIKVQKGIAYSPDNDFYAFDIRLGDEYLEVDQCNQRFEQFGFFYAKSLFEGSFKECLAYPNEFGSKIPEWLGLPLLEDNKCEGVIIKPAVPAYLNGGSRIIIKNKNERWAEKAKQRKRERKPQVTLDEAGNEMLEELLSLITENRLKNVISKIGTIQQKDFGKLMGALNVDVWEEFSKDYSDQFDTLEKEEQKLIKKKMGVSSANLIKSNFMEIVEGDF